MTTQPNKTDEERFEEFDKVNSVEHFTDYTPKNDGNVYSHYKNIFMAGIESERARSRGLVNICKQFLRDSVDDDLDIEDTIEHYEMLIREALSQYHGTAHAEIINQCKE